MWGRTHLLILHEERDVLVDPLLDGDGVVVADGILSQEVELDDERLPWIEKSQKLIH